MELSLSNSKPEILKHEGQVSGNNMPFVLNTVQIITLALKLL
jgi:hypothetical protein